MKEYFELMSNEVLEEKRAELSFILYLIGKELKGTRECDAAEWVMTLKRAKGDSEYLIKVIDEILNERI